MECYFRREVNIELETRLLLAIFCLPQCMMCIAQQEQYCTILNMFVLPPEPCLSGLNLSRQTSCLSPSAAVSFGICQKQRDNLKN